MPSLIISSKQLYFIWQPLKSFFFHEWQWQYIHYTVYTTQYTVTDEWLDFFNQGLGIYIIVITHWRKNYIKNYDPKTTIILFSSMYNNIIVQFWGLWKITKWNISCWLVDSVWPWPLMGQGICRPLPNRYLVMYIYV